MANMSRHSTQDISIDMCVVNTNSLKVKIWEHMKSTQPFLHEGRRVRGKGVFVFTAVSLHFKFEFNAGSYLRITYLFR